MSSDEPSIPMDQEEEDNDEYFSARESQKRSSAEGVKTPVTSDQSPNASPNITDSSPRQELFFSDEKAQAGGSAENPEVKKSAKVKKLNRNRWDVREWKKEELERPVKPKKKKKKTKKSSKKKDTKREKKEAKEKQEKEQEKQEKSKTDEDSEDKEEEDEEAPAPKQLVKALLQDSPRKETPRPHFQSEQLVLKTKFDNPIAPRCSFNVLRFTKTQEIIEYDAEGMQHQLPQYTERAISNPWRRWGAHEGLSNGPGGYYVGKKKQLVQIKKGSEPPPCPPDKRQVTLNKNNDIPDSQMMMGTIKVSGAPADEEVHRIGKVMEEYVKAGGFVPPPMTRKEMAVKPKQKGAKTPKKKKNSNSCSQESGEDDSQTEAKPKPIKDDSKKGTFGFLKRKKSQPNAAMKASEGRRNKNQ